MREILFRGKDKYNGEWIEGYYYLSRSKYAGDKSFVSEVHTITTGIREVSGAYGEHSETIKSSVIPETVGQYTGLTDKNGKKIFEGDIVKILYTDWISQPLEDTRSLEEYLDSLTEKGVVDFAPYVGWYLKNGKYDLSIISGTHGYIEVIDNIHDNPELLKVGD